MLRIQNLKKMLSNRTRFIVKLKNRMRCVGAIDQGTQSTRFSLFDKNKNVIASFQKEFTQIHPEPGSNSTLTFNLYNQLNLYRWCEHDPMEIMDTVHECIEKCIKVCFI